MKIKVTNTPNKLAKLLAKKPSFEEEAEFKKLMIAEQIVVLMKEKKINRVQLAKRMKVQPSRITSMLNGTNNFTIDTLVRAAHALGATLEQTLVPEGETGRWMTSPTIAEAPAISAKVIDLKHSTPHFLINNPNIAPDDNAIAS